MTAIQQICTMVKKMSEVGHTDATYITQMEISWSLTCVHVQEIT